MKVQHKLKKKTSNDIIVKQALKYKCFLVIQYYDVYYKVLINRIFLIRLVESSNYKKIISLCLVRYRYDKLFLLKNIEVIFLID